MSAVLPLAQVPMRTGPAARFGLGSLPQIAAVLALMLAGVLAAATVNGYYVFVLANVALLAIVGIGLNVLQGLTGQVSFGHVGFYAIGAYTVGILCTKAGWSYPSIDEEWLLGYPQEILDFCESVAFDRPPLSGAELGRQVVEVMYAAYLSAEEGKRVNLTQGISKNNP